MSGARLSTLFVTLLALGAFAAPSGAATTNGSFIVNINLSDPSAPPAPPPGGMTPPPGVADVCVSQTLTDATGAMVRVLCTTGQFVSIEADRARPYRLGVHGGAYRFYFADGLPASLRFMSGANPWVGPGTVTSLRVNYLEDLDGIIEMQVGF